MFHRQRIFKRHIKNYLGSGFVFLSLLSLIGVGFSAWVIDVDGGDAKDTDLAIEADTVVKEDKYVQCFENIQITRPLYYSSDYGYLGDDSMFSKDIGTIATFEGSFELNVNTVKTTDTIDYKNMKIKFTGDGNYTINSLSLIKKTNNDNITLSAIDTTSYSVVVNADNITHINFSFSITIEYTIDFTTWLNSSKTTLHINLE